LALIGFVGMSEYLPMVLMGLFQMQQQAMSSFFTDL